MIRFASFKKLFALIALLVISYIAGAQLLGPKTEKTEEIKETPQDSLGRRTPNGTVKGFVQAMADQNYVRASQYLELRKRTYKREKERERIVKSFQRLLDNSGDIIPPSLISNKETGRTDDDIEPGVDMVGTVTADGKVIELYVANQSAEGEPALWLFSSETVDAIAAIRVEDTTLLERILPEVLKERTLGGVPVGHWLAVVVIILLSYLIAWGTIALIGFIVMFFWKKETKEKATAVIDAFSLPLRLYLAVWLFVAFCQHSGISIIVRQKFSYITITIGMVAFLILLWRITDVVGNYTKNRMTLRGRISAISVILFLKRAAKIAIVIIGIIAVLGIIGFDLTAWIAALGIGGLALALGAQKTVENFVGSVTLIADQPVRVGDYCKIGETKGTVESIGMRSTTLRTTARTIVTIPNGMLAAAQIENYAHRDRFLFNPIFTFRMETTPDQLRFLLVELRAILYSHPKVTATPNTVRFTGITADALKVEISAYIEAGNFDESQEIQEDILLHMMDVIEKSGTGLAYPSQTIYMARDEKPSEEKASEIAETVKQWKDNNELQLPKFDPKHVDKIKGTLDYPEKGSVMREDKKEE